MRYNLYKATTYHIYWRVSSTGAVEVLVGYGEWCPVRVQECELVEDTEDGFCSFIAKNVVFK